MNQKIETQAETKINELKLSVKEKEKIDFLLDALLKANSERILAERKLKGLSNTENLLLKELDKIDYKTKELYLKSMSKQEGLK